jgi:23S rRNA pseudouridine2605 synthase
VAEGIRVQKYLSMAGRASRREAERFIRDGRVRVNGQVVVELGVRVVPGLDRVEVDEQVVGPLGEARWIAFHKPAGVLTTRSDPHGGRTVYDVLPADASGLRYVGRLDRDTEGLLLLSNEGDVINALLHPSRQVEREYRAWVVGSPGRSALVALLNGVELGDGPARATRVQVLRREAAHAVLSLVLTEGRKREVRRMLDRVGHPVRRLTRVRFGTVELGDLPAGAWRPLGNEERTRLLALAGIAEP